MLIVLLSIAGIFMDKLNTKAIPINPTIIRVMRVLRIARGKYSLSEKSYNHQPIKYRNIIFLVLKLLKMAKGIRSLLDTVIQALPQVGNLGLLFFLLFFIFAILGVELFGKLSKWFLLYGSFYY
jgi:voltage-dependent calcium channel T type alpha-1G